MKPDYDEDDDRTPDYFDGEDIEEPKKEKKPKYSPEDPRYWLQRDDKWEHLRPSKRITPLWWWLAGALLISVLGIVFWMRYFSPYIEGATQAGYVDSIESRGKIFKTYEGVLLPYKELMDTTRIYSRDFIFSTTDSKVAATIKKLMLAGKPVRVEYKQYHATVPWRGSSKIIVIRADSINPDILLPPDRRPEYKGK